MTTAAAPEALTPILTVREMGIAARRAGRVLGSLPTAQKNDSRGANRSTSRPTALPARRYSIPSARV